MSSTDTGYRAEQAAASYLEMRGFTILELNWRRPHCEVDIIARDKSGAVHFVEVKYRATNDQGGGFEAITTSKLNRMRRGAQTWVEEEKWQGEYLLSAVEVGGRDFTIMGFIEGVL